MIVKSRSDRQTTGLVYYGASAWNTPPRPRWVEPVRLLLTILCIAVLAAVVYVVGR